MKPRREKDRLAEVLQEILRRCDQSEPIISRAFGDGGIDPLWPRFERAAINQIEGGEATVSRYAIWANTVRDNIVDAMRLLEDGDQQTARSRLIRAVNSLSAFSEVQALVDPLEDAQGES